MLGRVEHSVVATEETKKDLQLFNLGASTPGNSPKRNTAHKNFSNVPYSTTVIDHGPLYAIQETLSTMEKKYEKISCSFIREPRTTIT